MLNDRDVVKAISKTIRMSMISSKDSVEPAALIRRRVMSDIFDKFRLNDQVTVMTSGVGLIQSTVAVGLGACFVERHITLDRAMWGSDHSAPVEPEGLSRSVKYIRVVEAPLGDGEKKVYESEKGILSKLRKVDSFNK
jgi:sialic acid synthase SpsE